jgi:hypothetical protein
MAETSRRALLKAFAGGAALTPLLPLFEARAQTTGFPRRLIQVFYPHGTVYQNWNPVGAGSQFTLGSVLAPLEPHRDKLLILDGIQMTAGGPGNPHVRGPALLFTGSPLVDDGTFKQSNCDNGCTYGWNSGPSVDQVIAQAVGSTTPYRSLEFGVRVGANFGYSNPADRISYAGPAQPRHPEHDPSVMFNRIFGQGVPSSALDRLRFRRRSVIDLLKAELAEVQGKVSTADRYKLEAHLEGVRSIEQRLGGTMPVCSAPTVNSLDPNAVGNVPAITKLQIDLLVKALACDLTRVVTWQNGYGSYPYTWLGHTENHHEISHYGDGDPRLTEVYVWQAQQVAYLLDELKKIPEGNGTLLDNTMVVWGSEISWGAGHTFQPMPFVIAGGAGGYLRPGRVVRYNGASHCRLLVSMANAMGLNQVQSFGSLDTGTGPLPGLT